MWSTAQDLFNAPPPHRGPGMPSSQEPQDPTTPRFINHQDDIMAQFGLFVEVERTPVFGEHWVPPESPGRLEEMPSESASPSPKKQQQLALRKRSYSTPLPITTVSKTRRLSSLPPAPLNPPSEKTQRQPFTPPQQQQHQHLRSPTPPSTADSFSLVHAFHLTDAPRFVNPFEIPSSPSPVPVTSGLAARNYAAVAGVRPSFATAKSNAITALSGHCVPELQCALRARGLPVSGLRHDLLERLGEDLARERTHLEGSLGETSEEIELSKFRVPELKEMCRARGLSVGGLKGDLKRRLCRSSW